MSIIPAHNYRRIYGKIPSKPLSYDEARAIAGEFLAKGIIRIGRMTGDQAVCFQCNQLRYSTRESGVCQICEPDQVTEHKKSKTILSRNCDRELCRAEFHPNGAHAKYCSTECGALAKREYEAKRYRNKLTISRSGYSLSKSLITSADNADFPNPKPQKP